MLQCLIQHQPEILFPEQSKMYFVILCKTVVYNMNPAGLIVRFRKILIFGASV